MQYFKKLLLLTLFGLLAACASTATNNRQNFVNGGADYFPGGTDFYCYGYSNEKEYFLTHIEQAQSYYGLFAAPRTWTPVGVGTGCTIIALQSYAPLSVRWKLKDGREFIIDALDLRPYLREYFKNNDITMPWIREGRTKDKLGDAEAALAFQIKEDGIYLIWYLRVTETPVEERFKRDAENPKGKLWKMRTEFYPIATIKATQTSGIDFNKTYE